jgi:hypothetical protein
MSIQQRMHEQRSEIEARKQMEETIRQFCQRMNLKADEREATLQFIADELDDRDMLARTVAFNSAVTVLTDAETRTLVVGYLAQFSQHVEGMAAELNSLAKQAKDELAMLVAN